MIGVYRDRDPGPFRAVQWDGTNLEEILRFAAGHSYALEGDLWLSEPDMEEMVPVGYWILEGDDRTFFVSYPDDEFHKDFELLGTRLEDQVI